MKLVYSLALLLAFGALTVPVSADEKADPKAEALRGLMAKFESKLVTVNWVTKTSAMGNEIETPGSATGIVIGDKGLVAVSAQPFANPMGGLAGMFGGRGGRGGGGGAQQTGPEDFRVAMGKGSVEALNVLEDKDTNLRFFAGKFEEGKTPAAIAWPEKVSVPALGEEVVVLGCYDATLNHARFFKTARINSVIEDGKYYGLDGSMQDCLGGLVVTYGGSVLGVIAQKPAEDTGSGGGGIGGILGGMSDPSKMLGNRVLITPAVFAAVIKKAQEKMADPNFGKPVEKPVEKPPVEKPAEPKTEDPPVETPPEKKHNWRGLTRVIGVDEKILKGKYGEAKGGIMVSAKPETDSMCAKAGLANGDLILKVGDTAIAADLTPDKFWEMIEKLDGSVKISVARFGGKTYDLTIDTK